MRLLASTGSLIDQPVHMEGVKTIVVWDEFDNPVFVAIQQDEHNILAVDASDPRFDKIISDLPVSRHKLLVERG